MASSAGVLFDVDGTLLDTNYLHVLAWWQAFRDTSQPPVTMAQLHRVIGIASDELVTTLTGHDSPETVQAHSDRYDALRDEVVALPGAGDLLRACARLGLTVVLATSGAAADLDWMLPAIDAGDAVAGSTTSDDVEKSKPAPDLLQTAVGAHDLDADRTVAVGDTVWDVRSARDAGLRCIGLTCGGISEAELREAGAVEVWTDPADLLAHLDDSVLTELVASDRQA